MKLARGFQTRVRWNPRTLPEGQVVGVVAACLAILVRSMVRCVAAEHIVYNMRRLAICSATKTDL